MKRLDRQDFLEHFRRHGATKTFMAQTCDKFVENLRRANLCYVLPKYVLRYAWERSGDMRAAMRLALASEVEKVEDAACHGDTGVYDIFRHKHLRETFVSLFVLQDGQVVDGHRDFITGAGFTKHTVFISGLLDKNGWMTPLPKGPVNSQPGKKRPKAKAKRSARTKTMLAPPQPREVVGGKKGSKELLVFPRDVLPGRPSNADEPAFLHFSGLKDQDGMCLAPATKGHRCRKKRVCGIFCRQHYLDWSNDNKKQKIWGSVEKTFAQASDIWPR